MAESNLWAGHRPDTQAPARDRAEARLARGLRWVVNRVAHSDHFPVLPQCDPVPHPLISAKTRSWNQDPCATRHLNAPDTGAVEASVERRNPRRLPGGHLGWP